MFFKLATYQQLRSNIMKNSNRKQPPKFTKQSPLGSAIPKAHQKLPYGPHRSEFNTYIRLHPPKHLPEDERSFSRNVASLKNVIQNKTNCSSESIQHTESTNLNIFRIKTLSVLIGLDLWVTPPIGFAQIAIVFWGWVWREEGLQQFKQG